LISYRRDPIIPPGSRDPGIRNPPIPNPGIEKMGPGLKTLLSNEQAWLRFQQVGPKSKQGGLSPPGPPLTLTTGASV